MLDGVSRWNAAFNGAGSTSDLVRVTSGQNITAHELSDFEQQQMQLVRGLTVIDGGQGCFVHDLSVNSIFSAVIYIERRGDWFTQDDSRRALWEACPSNGFQPAYTCAKHEDFGSTFAHELGHAAGFVAHPQDVDGHAGNNQATTSAKCGIIPSRATMCPSGGEMYRTERRTLDTWDIESLEEIYLRF